MVDEELIVQRFLVIFFGFASFDGTVRDLLTSIRAQSGGHSDPRDGDGTAETVPGN